MFTLKNKNIQYELEKRENGTCVCMIKNTLASTNLSSGNALFSVRFTNGECVSSSDLTVGAYTEKDGTALLDFSEKCGIKAKLKIYAQDGVVKKQLTLSQTDDKIIDYIDLESIDVEDKKYFDVKVVSGGEIPAFQSMLGQPVYVGGIFIGCEFPATENRVINSKATVRYYLGKNVGENFSCPVTVVGGAQSENMQDLKKAFFEYIDAISVPIGLRFQYNSWYDYMRNIDESNILTSFKQVHDKLTQLDAPHISAYVVDDGWVDMKAKFWSYNKKFPGGMGKVSAFCAKELDSNFGMWLGPRGGYNDVYKLAKRFHRGKNGYVNRQAKDICVASSDYVNKLQNFLIEQTRLYKIDYWKFDGFALKPCRNKRHDHATGGHEDMYFVTDLWTKWIELYENLRAVRAGMWINMTCYVNVSPWWLQWVNSVWIQNSGDIGFAENHKKQPQVEAEITYRDGRYYDCLVLRKLQMPLKGIYNHEPIYGNEAKVKYSDEEFEKYLYWCTARGQALNELHLSPSMMDGRKWEILASVMRYQEENYHILQHAEFFGDQPLENGVYGFAAFDGADGIIAIRNPDDKERTFEVQINEALGAPKSLKDGKLAAIYGKSDITKSTYSFGDKLKCVLKPFEVLMVRVEAQ